MSSIFQFLLFERLDYSNGFLCPEAIFQSINLWTYIERINKQLVVDINWFNQGIWKSAFSKAIQSV